MTQKSNRALQGRRRTRRKGKSSSNGFRSCKLSLETLEQRQLLSVNPIISEFMASNSTTLKDYYGKYPDWLEIYNPDTAALNFSGWKLKDNSTVWTIPANVTIPAAGLLEGLLRQPRHGSPQRRIAHQLQARRQRRLLGTARSPTTPWFRNMRRNIPSNTPTSPTVWLWSRAVTPIVSSGAAAKVLVPTSSNGGSTLGTTWQGQSGNEPFNDSSWQSGTTGIGMLTTVTPIASANLKLRLNANTSSDDRDRHFGSGPQWDQQRRFVGRFDHRHPIRSHDAQRH